MKQILFIVLILYNLNFFGQNSDIENFINQVAKIEVPENYEYYYLIPKSLEKSVIHDSLQNYQIRELKISDKDFPTNIIYKELVETIDWKNYNLQNVRYVSSEYKNPISPLENKNVQFVEYKIEAKVYDSLVRNNEENSLLVKKKWFWNKSRIWKNKKFYKELVTASNIDYKINYEKEIFFQFSKPLFSEDKKYARITICKNRSFNGNGFTAIYKNDNGIWIKLIEYNRFAYAIAYTL